MDGMHILSEHGERLGLIPIPAVAANVAFGGLHDRRLFIAASQYLFAIDLIG